MKLSAMAVLSLSQLDAAERERIENWAEQIARANGHEVVLVSDVRAAIACAGKEFLPTDMIEQGEALAMLMRAMEEREQ